jgi:hypothetical protein
VSEVDPVCASGAVAVSVVYRYLSLGAGVGVSKGGAEPARTDYHRPIRLEQRLRRA